MTPSHLSAIIEGSTPVLVYAHQEKRKGPAKKQQVPFYNPAMEMNRDISIAFVQWLVKHHSRPVEVLDGLASSGIRGLRIANEVSGKVKVTINDWSTLAFDLIQRNLSHVSVSNACATCEDVHVLLSRERYDYVDIDPFGTPAIFVDSAVRGLRHKAILAVTATDTATLCGVYPTVCRRRYGSRPYHSPMMHEIGLRILIGFLARVATTFDAGIVPLLCYSTDHYMRVYVQILRRVSDANKSMEQVQIISSSSLAFQSEKKHRDIGPLWMGMMEDAQTIGDITDMIPMLHCGSEREMRSLLELLKKEACAPPFFYTVNAIASVLKTSPPSRSTLFQVFQERNLGIWRTHVDPTGFKTTATESEIIEAFHQAKQVDQ